MGKAELQSDISSYQNQINSNNYEITKLKEKIDNIEEEIVKRESSISIVSGYFSEKRGLFSNVDLNDKGKAVSNFVRANLEKYSVGEENKFVVREDSIIGYFQDNISKLEERIYELEYENSNFDRLITECNNEIADIERQEAEELKTSNTSKKTTTTKSSSSKNKNGGTKW